MHTNINDNDTRITAYLKGKMTAEEEQAFLQEVKANPELKAQTIAIARMVKAMKVVGSERDKATIESLKKASSEDVKNATKAKVTPKIQSKKAKTLTFKRMLPWMGLAASVALIVWISVGRNNPVTEGNTIPQMANNPQQTTEDLVRSTGAKSIDALYDDIWNLKDNTVQQGELKQLEEDWVENKTKETGCYLIFAYLTNENEEDAQRVLTEFEGMIEYLEEDEKNDVDKAIEALYLNWDKTENKLDAIKQIIETYFQNNA